MNRYSSGGLMIALTVLASASAQTATSNKTAPLMIQEQGSFAVGGKVITNPGAFNPKQPAPDGQTLHGDHAYVFYQIPVKRRKLPLVFLHGTGQFSKTWETTPDGREGFQTMFLRRRFPVYLIDQPRRGNAGRSTVSATINATPDEQQWFNTFRVGIWPAYFPDVQFSKDPEALNQYFRQMTPNVGPYDPEVNSDAFAALFNKIGPAVFVTHSQGGGLGWMTALKSGNVRAIVSYEPGSGFLFPEGEAPEALPSSGGTLTAIGAPMAEFTKLTKIPIIIFYGDFIPEKPSDNPGQDGWRVRLEMARKWRDTVPHSQPCWQSALERKFGSEDELNNLLLANFEVIRQLIPRRECDRFADHGFLRARRQISISRSSLYVFC